jgi:hypothetical protein
MAIEIVDLPIQNGDFPWLCKRLPEGNHQLVFFSHDLSIMFLGFDRISMGFTKVV